MGTFPLEKTIHNQFCNEVTNNPNHKFRQCLKPKDVYDWYNKTPMTLGHSTVDLAIPPENTSKTIDVQRKLLCMVGSEQIQIRFFLLGAYRTCGWYCSVCSGF